MRKKLIILLLSVAVTVTGCSATSLENTGKEIKDTIDDFTDSDNKYVKMVKGGYRENNPDLTYGQAFSDFFGTPRWHYFLSDEGDDVVEFTGDCTYQDVAVKARIQFIVDEENGTFEIAYFDLNEVPQNMLTLASLMANVFGYEESTLGEVAYSDNSILQNEADKDTGENTDESVMLEEDARALLEQWFAENSLIYYDYTIELSEKYVSGVEHGGYWYDLYIGDLFYDMIYVDASTGELLMGEGDIVTSMDQWYAETWLPLMGADAYLQEENAGETSYSSNDNAFIGSWSNLYESWMDMEITCDDGMHYQIDISKMWNPSEIRYWHFIGYYDASLNGLVYSDGVCWDMEQMEETVVYTNGDGAIMLGDNGFLYWIDDEDEFADESCFVPSGD